MNPDADTKALSLFAPRAFAAWLALAVILSYPDVIFGFGAFVLRDFSTFGYPLAAFHKASFWQGEIPLWNPLVYCGVPHLAQWNTMTLYPGSLIYLLLPVSAPLALSWFGLLHLYAGGLGMYFLVRWRCGNDFPAALAGMAFAFSGLLQHSLMWPNNIAALGLMPWVVLTVLIGVSSGGRKLLWAVAVGSAQMLAGAPEMILTTWFLAAGATLVEAARSGGMKELKWPVIRLVGIVAGITGLTAIQLLPFFDLAEHSLRITHGQATDWSAGAVFWVNMFLPLAGASYFENGVVYLPGQQWINSVYSGLPIIWLALLALRARRSVTVRVGTVAVLFSMLLAVGPDGHLFAWMNRLLPLDAVRYPVKFLIPVFFILPLLAAKGASLMSDPKESDLRNLRMSLTITIGLSLLSAWMIGTAIRGEDEARSIANGGFRLLWLIGAALLLISAVRSQNFRQSAWLQVAVVIVTWWDLRTHLPALAPTVTPRIYEVENEGIAQLSPAPVPGSGRLFRLPETLWRTDTFTDEGMDMSLLLLRAEVTENMNMATGIASIRGFLSLWFPRWEGTMELLVDRHGRLNEELADFLAISHTNSRDQIAQWNRRARSHGWVSAGMAPQFRGTRETYERIANGSWDAQTEVFLESRRSGDINATGDPDATVSNVVFGNQRIGFEIECSKPTTATIAQFHHHWWTATINGKPVEVLPANLGFQAVVVPAGKNSIELRYVDKRFQLGALVSGLTLLVGIFLWWHWRPTANSAKAGKAGPQA